MKRTYVSTARSEAAVITQLETRTATTISLLSLPLLIVWPFRLTVGFCYVFHLPDWPKNSSADDDLGNSIMFVCIYSFENNDSLALYVRQQQYRPRKSIIDVHIPHKYLLLYQYPVARKVFETDIDLTLQDVLRENVGLLCLRKNMSGLKIDVNLYMLVHKHCITSLEKRSSHS